MKKRFVSNFANFGSKNASASSSNVAPSSATGASSATASGSTPISSNSHSKPTSSNSSSASHGNHGPSSAKTRSLSAMTPGSSGSSPSVASSTPNSARASRRYTWADRVREKLPPLEPNEYEVLWERGVLGVIFLESEKDSIPYVSKATESCISSEISPGDTLKYVNVICSKDHSFSDFFKILATMKKPVLLRFERIVAEPTEASSSSGQDSPTRLDQRALSAGSMNSDPSGDATQPHEPKHQRSNSLSNQDNAQKGIRNTFWRSKANAMNAARASLNFKTSAAKPQSSRTPPLPPTIPEEGYYEYEVVWDHGSLGLIFAENKDTNLPIVSRTTNSNPVVQAKVMLNDTLLSANDVKTSDFAFDAFFAQLQHLQKPVVLKFRRKNHELRESTAQPAQSNEALTRSSVNLKTQSPVSSPQVRSARSPSTPVNRAVLSSPSVKGNSSPSLRPAPSPKSPSRTATAPPSPGIRKSSSHPLESPSVRRSPARGSPSSPPPRQADAVPSTPTDDARQNVPPPVPMKRHVSSDDVGVGPPSPTAKKPSNTSEEQSSRSLTGQTDSKSATSSAKPISMQPSAMSREVASAAASVGLARTKTVAPGSEGQEDREIAALVAAKDPKTRVTTVLGDTDSPPSENARETQGSVSDREFALPPSQRLRKDSGSDKKLSKYISLSPGRELYGRKKPAWSPVQTTESTKPVEREPRPTSPIPLKLDSSKSPETPPQSPRTMQRKGDGDVFIAVGQPDEIGSNSSSGAASICEEGDSVFQSRDPTSGKESLSSNVRPTPTLLATARARARSRSSSGSALEPSSDEVVCMFDDNDSGPSPHRPASPNEAVPTISASQSPPSLSQPPPPPPPAKPTMDEPPGVNTPKSSEKKRHQMERALSPDIRLRTASAEQPTHRKENTAAVSALQRAKSLSTEGQTQQEVERSVGLVSHPAASRTRHDSENAEHREVSLQPGNDQQRSSTKDDLEEQQESVAMEVPMAVPTVVEDAEEDEEELEQDEPKSDMYEEGKDDKQGDGDDDDDDNDDGEDEAEESEDVQLLEDDELDMDLQSEDSFEEESSSTKHKHKLKVKHKRHRDAEGNDNKVAVMETGIELNNDPLDSMDQDLDAMDGNEMMPGSSSKLKSESSSSSRSSRLGTNNQAAQKYKRKSKGKAMIKLPMISEQEEQTIPLVAPKSVNTSVQVRGRAKPKLTKRDTPDSATYLIKWKETGGIGIQLREVRLAKGVYPLVTDVCQQPCCECLKHVCVGDIVVEINGRNTSTMGVKKTVNFIRSCNKTTLLKFRRGPAFVNERVSALV